MKISTLVERRIEMVRTTFLKEDGWRYATSLYLIGGFARGEGTCREMEGRLHIYNDIDLLVVIEQKTLLRLAGLHRILRTLNGRQFGCPIDLVIVTKRELRHPPPTIQHFDLRRHHQWLWGEKVLEDDGMENSACRRISTADALQLLLNRQASLMMAMLMAGKKHRDDALVQVQISKPLLAMMAAVLIADEAYVTPVRDQLELIETRRSDQRNHALWEVFANDRLMALVREAVEFKHQPRCDHLTPFAETIDTVARAYYDFVVKFIIQHYGCDDSLAVAELAVCMDRHQPRQLDLLSAGWWACRLRARSSRLKARWPRVAPHPQIGVYAASLLWMSQYVSACPHDWRRWLPVSGCDDDGLDLLIRAWRICGYGCRIC